MPGLVRHGKRTEIAPEGIFLRVRFCEIEIYLKVISIIVGRGMVDDFRIDQNSKKEGE